MNKTPTSKKKIDSPKVSIVKNFAMTDLPTDLARKSGPKVYTSVEIGSRNYIFWNPLVKENQRYYILANLAENTLSTAKVSLFDNVLIEETAAIIHNNTYVPDSNLIESYVKLHLESEYIRRFFASKANETTVTLCSPDETLGRIYNATLVISTRNIKSSSAKKSDRDELIHEAIRCMKEHVSKGFAEYGKEVRKVGIQPMLAVDSKGLDCAESKIKFDCDTFVMRKYDGVRMMSLCSNGKIVLTYSRGLNEISVPMMIPEIESLASSLIGTGQYGSDVLIDGELYIHGLSHDEINGALKSYSDTKKQKYENVVASMKYVIFGIFFPESPEMDLVARQGLLKGAMQHCEAVFLERAPIWKVTVFDEIRDAFNLAVAERYEGIMVYRNAPYEPGSRTKNILKVKNMDEIDLPLIDIVSAEGAEEGLAMFVVSHNGRNLNLRPTMTNKERAEILRTKPYLPGSIIRVKFYGYTTDVNLRHPTFVKFAMIIKPAK